MATPDLLAQLAGLGVTAAGACACPDADRLRMAWYGLHRQLASFDRQLVERDRRRPEIIAAGLALREHISRCEVCRRWVNGDGDFRGVG